VVDELHGLQSELVEGVQPLLHEPSQTVESSPRSSDRVLGRYESLPVGVVEGSDRVNVIRSSRETCCTISRLSCDIAYLFQAEVTGEAPKRHQGR
jgi:hypothetical protein